MNIAILIGVSRYLAASHLPACKNDVEKMHRLLQATKKYDEIVCITENTDAGQLKESLRQFFKKYNQTSSINEVLVYFSGHGIYHTDAMLCCSDYDPNRPSTTSISNDEIDDLLRSIGPEVAVKIIDACQSGSPYIKDAAAGFEKALKSSKLKSFICMSSSRQDQYSYASPDGSAFTEKWIDAALTKQDGIILYRDIQAALADSFVSNPEQTPFFVIQGNGLEAFAEINDDMKKLAIELHAAGTIKGQEEDIEEALLKEITRQDSYYVLFQEVIDAMTVSRTQLEAAHVADLLINKFYEKKVRIDGKLSGLPRAKSVADFAREQGWNKNYFVKIVNETYELKVPKDILSAVKMSSLFTRLEPDEFVTETRSRPHHLETTQALPFEVAEINFEPINHPSLKAFVLYLGFVHSLTEIVVLSGIIRYTHKGWEERGLDNTDIQWKNQTYLWKDVVANPNLLWEDALAQANISIRSYLESLLPKKDDSDNEEQDSQGA